LFLKDIRSSSSSRDQRLVYKTKKNHLIVAGDELFIGVCEERRVVTDNPHIHHDPE
jgi:hypothetical protein